MVKDRVRQAVGRRCRLAFRLAIVIGVYVAMTKTAFAADLWWNAFDGEFLHGSNWIGDACGPEIFRPPCDAPGPNDFAVFGPDFNGRENRTYDVFFPSFTSVQNLGLGVEGDDVTFHFDFSQYFAGDAYIAGIAGKGSLTIINGQADFGDLAVFNSGADTDTPNFNVVGPDAYVETQTFSIGGAQHTVVAISNSATLVSQEASFGSLDLGSEDEVRVTGGSTWTINNNLSGFRMAGNGTTRMTIAEGSMVRSGRSVVADWPRCNAVVTVTDSGSRWEVAEILALGGLVYPGTPQFGGGTGRLTVADGGVVTTAHQIQVGSYGIGELVISNAGFLSSRKGNSPTGSSGILGIGAAAQGAATITGSGSSWVSDGGLSVGWLGQGTLNVADGGLVRSFDVFVARLPGSTGHATVTGSGSNWTIDDALFVGGDAISAGGNGTLDVADGGAVNVGNLLQVWPDGTVNLRDARIHVGANGANIPTSPGTLYVGRDATVALTGGKMNVGNGVIPVITPSTIRVESNGTLAGSGTVVGNVDVAGGIVDPEAESDAPGLPRTLHINGDYTQEITGTLSIELAGKLPGQYDVLDVTGQANLSGTLVVTLDQFTPAAGDEFDILTCGDRNGGFLFKSLPPLSAGLSWSLDYGPNAVTLGVASSTPTPGDINLDRKVDRVDVALFASRFGATTGGGSLDGDFNGDGQAGLLDLAMLQRNFGRSVPGPSPASAHGVPEPASVVLAAMALLMVCVRRNRIGEGIRHA